MPGPRCVLVTGAAGNLGRKLVSALLGAGWCARVVGVDRALTPRPCPPTPGSSRSRRICAPARALRDTVAEADAVVHFAAENPCPDTSWAEAAASFDMIATLLARAAASGGTSGWFRLLQQRHGRLEGRSHRGAAGLRHHRPAAAAGHRRA